MRGWRLVGFGYGNFKTSSYALDTSSDALVSSSFYATDYSTLTDLYTPKKRMSACQSRLNLQSEEVAAKLFC